jgi:acetylornithine/LysW-gamma-L-lysine aminotransferase
MEYLNERQLSKVREVRGRGLLIGIELKERVQPTLVALMERGVLALPAGPNVLRLLPPLVISDAEIDQALAIICEVLA